MEQSNQSKKVLLSVIGVAILVVAVVGVSFAFFNYTRTGAANTVSTGKINFQSTQTANPVQVSNLFPMASAPAANDTFNASTSNYARTVIHVEGETTYDAGLDYQISAVQANLTVGSSLTPLPLKVHVYEDTAGRAGTETGDSLTIVSAYATGANLPAATKTPLATGHIAGTSSYTDGDRYTRDIVVDAYLLSTDIAITDTPEESSAWIGARTSYSTADWNALATSGASFKILVESSETGGSYVAGGNYS